MAHLTSPKALLIIAAVSVGSLLVSLLATSAVLVRLPADYFSRDRRAVAVPGRWSPGRVIVLVLKNILGWLLVAVGIVLSVPGVPGQGLLTILLGVMLVDFPGKYRVERWIVRLRPVRKGVEALRRKFGRPPFTFPGE